MRLVALGSAQVHIAIIYTAMLPALLPSRGCRLLEAGEGEIRIDPGDLSRKVAMEAEAGRL